MNLFEKPSAPGALFVLAFFAESSNSSIDRGASNWIFSFAFSFASATVSTLYTSPRKFLMQSSVNIFSSGFL